LLYRSALDNLPANDVPSRITVGQGLGLMRFRLGRHDDALKDLSAALALARDANASSAQLNLLLDEAIVLDWLLEWTKSRALSEEADALVANNPELETPLIQARLLMARGRGFHRTSRFADAVPALQGAIAASEKLGEEGYEPLTQSLAMLVFCAANNGQLELAEEATNRVLSVFGEHGDMLGIAGTLHNRCMLSLLTNNIERLVSDLERIVQISREYGFSIAEGLAVRDLAEVSYMLGRGDDALPFARRSLEMSRLQFGDSNRNVFYGELQIARILGQRGDVAEAAEIIRHIAVKQAEAKASGRQDALLIDVEQMLLDAIELSLRGGSAEAFDELIARGRAAQMQPQDVVEMMEWKGLAALRSGRRDEAIHAFEEALAEAEKNAGLVADRIRRRIADANAAPNAPRAAEGR
jgi:tetratricopeptide (TPR) repeat protein